MVKITAEIDGMVCGMCETHINEAIHKTCNIKKVTSSHRKGLVEILSDSDISDEALRCALDPMGYVLVSAEHKPYQKKGLFR